MTEHAQARRELALVAVGGSLGALARLLLVQAAGPAAFPWATLFINLAGSLLLGFVLAPMARSHGARALLATGFCGGFTTFSAFSFELLDLLQRSLWMNAALYVVASVAGCMAAVMLGLYVGTRAT